MIRAAMQKAREGQRAAFMTILRVHDFLVPEDAAAAKLAIDALGRPAGEGARTAERVKEACAAEADALIAKYLDAPFMVPDCDRAAAHLQMAALAIGAQRSMLQEAASGTYLHTNDDTLKARSVVAGALGVVAPESGEQPYGTPVMWLPNRAAITLSWDKQATLLGMVNNFEADLYSSLANSNIDCSHTHTHTISSPLHAPDRPVLESL